MQKILLSVFVVALVVGGGAFYGGMKYESSKNPFADFSRQNFQNMSPEQRQQIFQGNIGGNFQGGAGRRTGQNFLGGEVIEKDGQGLVVKLPDGGSRIIFFSGSTEISKSTGGSIDDIEIGNQVMVSGAQNADGSYTAKIIQLSPRHPGL